jgi:hypothetical protein
MGQSPKPPSDTAVRLASILRSSVLGLHPNNKVPENLNPWARVLDLMMRIDKRNPSEIEATLAWLFGPNQLNSCVFVVLAPKTLREKWDRIQIQRGRGAAHPEIASRPQKGTWREYSPQEKERARRERPNVQLELKTFMLKRGWTGGYQSGEV